MTREKVIEGLEKALAISKEVDSGYIWITVGEGKKALELLKEQEPKSAIIEGSDVAHVGRCPSCHVILTPFRANYCYCCGRKVKWDD